MSLAIFFSFSGINFRVRCDSHESHLTLFWTIYFPIAPFAVVYDEIVTDSIKPPNG